MKFFVFSDGEVTGPFGEEDIRAAVKEGRLLSRTQVCEEGGEAWTPVCDRFQNLEHKLPPPPPDHNGNQERSGRPLPLLEKIYLRLPSGVRGAVHEGVKPAVKFAAPLAAVGGFISDVLQPIGPLSFWLFVLSLLATFGAAGVIWVRRKSPRGGSGNPKLEFRLLCFSAIAAIVLGFSWIVFTSTSPERGFLASKSPEIASIQESLLGLEESVARVEQGLAEVTKGVDEIGAGMNRVEDAVGGLDVKVSLIGNLGALIANPETSIDYANNARVYEAQGSARSAVENWEQYAALNGEYIDLYFEFIDDLIALKGISAAGTHYQKLVSGNPENELLRLARFKLIEDTSGRVAFLQDVVRRDAEDFPANFYLSKYWSLLLLEENEFTSWADYKDELQTATSRWIRENAGTGDSLDLNAYEKSVLEREGIELSIIAEVIPKGRRYLEGLNGYSQQREGTIQKIAVGRSIREIFADKQLAELEISEFHSDLDALDRRRKEAEQILKEYREMLASGVESLKKDEATLQRRISEEKAISEKQNAPVLAIESALAEPKEHVIPNFSDLLDFFGKEAEEKWGTLDDSGGVPRKIVQHRKSLENKVREFNPDAEYFAAILLLRDHLKLQVNETARKKDLEALIRELDQKFLREILSFVEFSDGFGFQVQMEWALLNSLGGLIESIVPEKERSDLLAERKAEEMVKRLSAGEEYRDSYTSSATYPTTVQLGDGSGHWSKKAELPPNTVFNMDNYTRYWIWRESKVQWLHEQEFWAPYPFWEYIESWPYHEDEDWWSLSVLCLNYVAYHWKSACQSYCFREIGNELFSAQRDQVVQNEEVLDRYITFVEVHFLGNKESLDPERSDAVSLSPDVAREVLRALEEFQRIGQWCQTNSVKGQFDKYDWAPRKIDLESVDKDLGETMKMLEEFVSK